MAAALAPELELVPRRYSTISSANPITLSPWQTSVYQAGAHFRQQRWGTRFRTIIAGRRSGKTFEIVPDAVSAAVEMEHANVGYWAPTWSMAKDLLWEPLKRYIPPRYLRSKPSESELVVDLINHSRIFLRSGDNPDRSRGPGWDAAFFDESSFFDAGIVLWEEVVYPALLDRGGSAAFYTTPKGLNWMYDMYLRGLNKAEWPDWQSWQIKTIDGGRVPKNEIDKARRTMDPRRFRQEFEASFEALGNRVYDMFDPTVRSGHVREDIVDNGGDLLVGIDFNVNPMSLVLGTAAGDECHIFDSIAIHSSNTQEAAQELRRRFPERTIIACPDPSGRAKKSSAVGGTTDFTILESFGIICDAPAKAPNVSDRINALQAMFLNAEGKKRLFIHPRAFTLIRALMGQTYKEGTSIPEKEGFDHPNDALGYLVYQRFNLLAGQWYQSRATW